MPSLSLSHSPVADVHCPGGCPWPGPLCSPAVVDACLLLQLPLGPSSRAVHSSKQLPCFLHPPKDDSPILNGVLRAFPKQWPDIPQLHPGCSIPRVCCVLPGAGPSHLLLLLCYLVSLIAECHTLALTRVVSMVLSLPWLQQHPSCSLLWTWHMKVALKLNQP